MNTILRSALIGLAATGSLLSVAAAPAHAAAPAAVTASTTTSTDSARLQTGEQRGSSERAFPSIRPRIRASASCGGMWVRVNHNRAVQVRPGGLFPSKSSSQRYWVRPNTGCWAHIEGHVDPHECGGQYRELNTILERSVLFWQVSRVHKNGQPC